MADNWRIMNTVVSNGTSRLNGSDAGHVIAWDLRSNMTCPLKTRHMPT